jgi:predicted phage terminase large subunit-like protein
VAGPSLDIKLLPWQEEVWKDPTRFKVIVAGRRCGKSNFAKFRLVMEALETPNCEVFYVTGTMGQARKVMWKELLEFAHPVLHPKHPPHVNNLEVTLINGSVISLRGADRPDTMRGVKLKFVVLDEFADVALDVWDSILRPALADLKGDAIFISTPKGRTHLWDLYQKGAQGDDPDWKSWHLTTYDNPTIDPAEIDAAKKSMSSFAFHQEFMASFASQGSVLFKDEWIKYGDEPEFGDYYVAIDLAGFQEVGKAKSKNSRLDESAIAIVKVTPEGNWWIKDILRGRWELNETANKIFQTVADIRPVAVGIEKGIARQAVMSPLSDLQRKYNKFFNVKDLTHGNQRKTDRVVWALQGRFENGRITLNKGDWNEQFLDQLFQFPSSLTHDDLIDALAYCDQLAQIPYGISDFEDTVYKPLDIWSGY